MGLFDDAMKIIEYVGTRQCLASEIKEKTGIDSQTICDIANDNTLRRFFSMSPVHGGAGIGRKIADRNITVEPAGRLAYDKYIADKAEKTESKKHHFWSELRSWITLAIAVIAILLSIFTFIDTRTSKQKEQSMQQQSQEVATTEQDAQLSSQQSES